MTWIQTVSQSIPFAIHNIKSGLQMASRFSIFDDDVDPSQLTMGFRRSCLLAAFLASSSAFVPQSTTRRRCSRQYAGVTIQETLEPEHDDRNEQEAASPWLSWMMRGRKPRGTNTVMMREAEALGGLPRSSRYSSRDWFHSAITLPNSGILRQIRSPVLAVTSWATFLSILHRKYLLIDPKLAERLYSPLAPHSLMMSALGLLLVFRTNSAYQRFAEGRAIWETIVNTSRDLFRLIMLFEQEIGLDRRRRIQRLLAAFPYLLRHRIRPNLVMRRVDDGQRDPENTILLYQDVSRSDNDPEWAAIANQEEKTGQSRRKTRPLYYVDKRSLPWRLLPTDALEPCARAQNRPLWVCDRMAKELKEVADSLPSFTNRERMTLLGLVDKLSRCIGGSERIHQTVVPLNYARHTLRALTIWLFSLPFVLLKDLKLLTGPVCFLMAWMLFGVFEIGYAIEDPFQGTLRLSILCDTVRRDVYGDENARITAFQLDEPPDEEEDDEPVELTDEIDADLAEDLKDEETDTTDAPVPKRSNLGGIDSTKNSFQ